MKEIGLEMFEQRLEDIKGRLVGHLFSLTMAYGEDFHESADYYRNEFGMDEEETEEGTKILKVLDFYNAGGCYFPVTGDFQVNEDSEWVTKAFYCLYVVKEKDKIRLKYYAFENDGMEYDSDESEPDHGDAKGLTLQELAKLTDCVYDFIRNIKE